MTFYPFKPVCTMRLLLLLPPPFFLWRKWNWRAVKWF